MDSSSIGSSSLASFIREQIFCNGPVLFPWFMEQALYHPEFGYYSVARTRIGRRGDFYTNVSTGSTFGQIIAAQILEIWSILGEPPDFKVVEQGAEDGRLAFDILAAIENASDPPTSLVYVIAEPIIAKQAEQRIRLKHRFAGRIQWVAALAELEAVNGVFLSNELVDAMPVHLVEYRENHWSELYVTCLAKSFEFVNLPMSSPALAEEVGKLPVPVHAPYKTEINLNANRWINEISSKLKNGFVLVVDYGYPRHEYYKPDRTEGTLACYSRHRRSFKPLERPGEVDITTHVDFTSLAVSAENANLHIAAYTDQHHFMVGATESHLIQIEREIAHTGMLPCHDQFLRKLKTLLHPGTMGMAFKYLLLSRRADLQVPSGFRYAREPRQALGLQIVSTKGRPGQTDCSSLECYPAHRSITSSLVSRGLWD
jgi:SAM-dependent MidA family methyltransferase